MKSSFRIVGLTRAQFEPLFSLNEQELAAKGARRVTVDAKPGFPCRIGLADAEIGETMILTNFLHHDVKTPYRASGPIYVREKAGDRHLKAGEIPEVVSSRTISVRAYDQDGLMLEGNVVPGTAIEPHLDRLFANQKVAYAHLHNAGAGCYSCKVERAKPSA